MSALTKSTKAALAGTALVIGLVSLATGIGFLSESSVFSLPPVKEKMVIKPGQPMNAQAVKEMQQTEAIVGQFLKFLQARQETRVLTKKEAESITVRFIKGSNKPKVLEDVALAARTKLSIYSMMTAEDKALWLGLYSNCLQKLGKLSESQRFLFNEYNCSMPRLARTRSDGRRDVLARQLATHRILESLLAQADSLNIRAGSQNEKGFEVASQVVNPVKDIDVLTELACSVLYKRSVYDGFEGSHLFFELFIRCGEKISDMPRAEALDSLNYIYATHSGGAATTEYLDQFKAHAMGITMAQYIKHREDNRY